MNKRRSDDIGCGITMLLCLLTAILFPVLLQSWLTIAFVIAVAVSVGAIASGFIEDKE